MNGQRDTRNNAVAVALNRDVIMNRQRAMLLGVFAFTFLTAIGAFVRVPLIFTPVPITLQTFFVVLCAAMLGPVYGTASQAAYLCFGVAGLPMFTTGGAGFGHLLGPTGGYIVGFIAAQPVIGFIVNRKPGAGTLRIAAGMSAGMAVIYLFGVTHLKIVTGTDIAGAISLGMLPFLPGAAVKLAAAVAIAAGLRKKYGI